MSSPPSTSRRPSSQGPPTSSPLDDVLDRQPNRQLNQQLFELLDQIPDAVLWLSPSWQITYANAAARRISRLTSADLNHRTHWELYPETVGTEIEACYRRVMSRRVAEHVEYFYAPFNVWLDIQVFPSGDGISLYYRDISRHKFTEDARDEANQKLQLVFESAPDAILCIGPDWSCTFANRAARIIFQSDEIVGSNLWSVFPANQREPFFSNCRLTMERRVHTEFEAFYPAPRNIWFKVFVRPFVDGIIIFCSDITARKKAEARRDASNRQLQQVFEATTDAVVSIARDWTFTFLNPRAAELLSVKGDLIGRNLQEEFPAVLHGQFQFHFDRAMEQRIPSEFEAFYPEPLNLWLNIQCRPSDDGIVVFFRDITAERTARQSLLDQKEALVFVQETARVANWEINLRTGTIIFSEGSYPVFGQPCSEITSTDKWEDMIYSEDREYVHKSTQNAISSGEVVVIDYRIVTPEGAIRWIESRRVPIYNDLGVATHVRGMSTDITSRKESEEELAASEERYRALADLNQKRHFEAERQRAELETIYATAPIGLALFDPVEFRYLRLNDREAAFFGLHPSEILGKAITEMAPIVGLRELFEEVAEGRPIINHLLEGKLATDPPDVHRFWTVSYLPVFGLDGKVQAITSASLEITNQKKSEAALIQSEKLAAVGRLASSISHEINNPLEAITNILYLIERDQVLPDQLKPLVDMAQAELSRVCQIATQTLRFHRQAVRAMQVSAENLIVPLLNLYQGRLANTGITVEAAFASSTPILCFENDIRQVLSNLIANAVDAMRQHGGRLIIRAHDNTFFSPAHPEGVRSVRITVADTGHGMTPEVRARIFEPFYTTKDLNGTGLGLWISLGIVSRHKGVLTLRSSTHPAHQGTIFSLILPVQETPTPLQP